MKGKKGLFTQEREGKATRKGKSLGNTEGEGDGEETGQKTEGRIGKEDNS